MLHHHADGDASVPKFTSSRGQVPESATCRSNKLDFGAQTRLGSVRIDQLEGLLRLVYGTSLQCVDNVWHKSCVLGILVHREVVDSQT